MPFDTEKLTPLIGTSIRSDAETLLGGAHAGEIRALLEARGVLIFPQFDLDDTQQLAFARTLGGVIDQGEKGIYKITLDPKENEKAHYLHGTVLWHFDGFGDDVPTLASLLTARRLSATGGQTEFANTYAAWDALPVERQRALEKLRVVHTIEASLRDVYPNPPADIKALWDRLPDKTHPLVWTHRSGRKSLLVGASAARIVGMAEAESRALLDELVRWSTEPRFVYRHEWAVGDLVIWDNTGCMHRVEAYPADSGRLMHRITLVGEEAIA